MIIYQDLISGDELIDDTYDIKEIDPITYEADCHYIEVPSGDGGDSGQGSDDQKKTVIDIIHTYNLQSVSFDKESFLAYVKKLTKNLSSRLEGEQAQEFRNHIAGFTKKIMGNLSDYQCYGGESLHDDGMVIFLKHRDDGVTPYVTICKHGLVGLPSEEKESTV